MALALLILCLLLAAVVCGLQALFWALKLVISLLGLIFSLVVLGLEMTRQKLR